MEKFSPLVSIIVPVFNVEPYLDKCLTSIISQSYKNLEIICINDGSTDNSKKILNKYKNKDSRIIVINQKNQGLSSARNVGIKISTGDLITFVDSDDWLEVSAIEKIYQNFTNPDIDIVCFGAKKKYDSFPQKEETFIKYKKSRNQIAQGIWLLSISVTAWAKIYRADFLKKNNLIFPIGLYYEDNSFYWQCISCANKISTIKDNLYNYRIRDDSIMSTSCNNGRPLDYLYGLDFIYERWRSNGYLSNNIDLFKWLFEDYARLGYQYLKKIDFDNYRNEVIIRENKWNLKARWGSVPYDIVCQHKISLKKSRFIRSIYKRMITINKYISLLKNTLHIHHLNSPIEKHLSKKTAPSDSDL